MPGDRSKTGGFVGHTMPTFFFWFVVVALACFIRDFLTFAFDCGRCVKILRFRF